MNTEKIVFMDWNLRSRNRTDRERTGMCVCGERERKGGGGFVVHIVRSKI